jgi:transcriptional regulator GlxA family with amidase domain
MKKQPLAYQQIVNDALAVAAGGDGPTGIAEMCRALGIGRRTLLRAFRAVLHETPSHYLHAMRLRTAQQILASTDTTATSVTEVATQCGFAELGRFAAVYRSAFGEYPSATLRRSSQARMRASRPETMRSPAGASRRGASRSS